MSKRKFQKKVQKVPKSLQTTEKRKLKVALAASGVTPKHDATSAELADKLKRTKNYKIAFATLGSSAAAISFLTWFSRRHKRNSETINGDLQVYKNSKCSGIHAKQVWVTQSRDKPKIITVDKVLLDENKVQYLKNNLLTDISCNILTSNYKIITKPNPPFTNLHIIIPKGVIHLISTKEGAVGTEVRFDAKQHTYVEYQSKDGYSRLFMDPGVFNFIEDNIHAGAFGADYVAVTDHAKNQWIMVWKIPNDVNQIEEYSPSHSMLNAVGTYAGYTKIRVDTDKASLHWLVRTSNKLPSAMMSTAYFMKDFNNPTNEELHKIKTLTEKLAQLDIKADNSLVYAHHAILLRITPTEFYKQLCNEKEIQNIIIEAMTAEGNSGGSIDKKKSLEDLCEAYQTNRNVVPFI